MSSPIKSGTSGASQPPSAPLPEVDRLSGIAQDAGTRVILFVPESVPRLVWVSKALQALSLKYLQCNATALNARGWKLMQEGVARFRSTTATLDEAVLGRSYSIPRIAMLAWISFPPAVCSDTCSLQLNLKAHRDLSNAIRHFFPEKAELALPSPEDWASSEEWVTHVERRPVVSAIPLPQEIEQADAWVRRFDDVCLEQFWSEVIWPGVQGLGFETSVLMDRPLHAGDPEFDALPRQTASAGVIREWMCSERGRAVLQRIYQLHMNEQGPISGHGPQLLPRETNLLRGLGGLIWVFCGLPTVFPDDLFRPLQKLRSLYLCGLGLNRLQGTLFHGLSSLNELRISHSKYYDYAGLVSIPENLFHGLVGLTSLDLSKNRLKHLPEGSLNGLTRLQILNLTYNRLETFPKSLFDELSSLTKLYLSLNALETIPEACFARLGQLRKLCLTGNTLRVLPESPFRGLSQLRELNLTRNRLQLLPETLLDGVNPSIRLLDLRYNPLHSFPMMHTFPGALTLQFTDPDQVPGEVELSESDTYGWIVDLSGDDELVCHPFLLVAGSGSQPCPAQLLAMSQAFDSYDPRSPLASLYQAVTQAVKAEPEGEEEAADNAEVVTIFWEELDAQSKSAITFKTWVELGRPSEWKGVFQDTASFARALKKYVLWRFDSLTPPQRAAVDSRVAELVRQETGDDGTCAPNWGSEHAFDNILLRIDAMVMVGFQEPDQEHGAKRSRDESDGGPAKRRTLD